MAALACLLLGAPPMSSASDPLDQWHWRNPLPDGNSLSTVTYANNTFVAVGQQVLTASDGSNWVKHTPGLVYGIGTNYGLLSIAWGNRTWVTVGSAQRPGGTGSFAVILTSSNLVSWVPQSAPQGISREIGILNDIVYADGKFVAIGEGYDGQLRQLFGAIIISADGVHWTEQRSGSSDTWLSKIIYEKGTFLAMGSHGAMVTSSNAADWSPSESGMRFMGGLAFGNGTYVALGSEGVLLSSDGLTWSNRSPSIGTMQVTFGNDVFVAAGGGGQIRTSPDGIKWTKRNSGTVLDIWDVAFGNGKFVGVGTGVLLVSTNGSDWANMASAVTTAGLQGATYSGDSFVAVGDGGTILQSSDGARWVPTLSGQLGVDFYGLAYGAGNLVAVGSRGTVLTSSNGLNWVTATNVGEATLWNVTYGSGQFVTVGTEGVILTSTNGYEWSAQDSGSTSILRGLAHGKGFFVASAGASVLLSANGAQWTEHSLGIDANASWLLGLGYGGGVFVGVGNNGLILVSSNALDWVVASSGTQADLYCAEYGNGTFLVVGASGTVLTSTNGTSWAKREPGTMNPIFGAAYGQGTFLAVGPGGVILQSGVVPSLGARLVATPGWTGGGFGITLTAPPGGQYKIQGSANLLEWVPLGTLSTTNTQTQFTDPEASQFSRRFYRALGQ
jgi:hypothetical protein